MKVFFFNCICVCVIFKVVINDIFYTGLELVVIKVMWVFMDYVLFCFLVNKLKS